MKMRFLPDEPITDKTEDIIGFSDFADLLRNSIYNTKAPFVYGVLGDWGVGKTSILNLLKNELTNDLQSGANSFIPIWFNAWQYENEANIIYPLLYAIKKDYSDRFKNLDKAKGFLSKFKDIAVASAMALSDISLRVVTKQLSGEALKLDDVSKQLELVKTNHDKIEKVFSEWADQVTKLQNAFEALLDTYADDMVSWENNQITDKNKVRFVILIDDLDRCLPETTIAILESIKNYLTVKNCIFILGLNPNVIYQGIRVKYQGLEIDGREYLEKILNYSFYVPEPELNKVAELVTKRFDELVLDADTRDKHKDKFTEFGKILEECNFNNPRKIKRILNRYLFFISKNEATFEKYHNSNIVRFIILAEYFPNLFQLFLKDEQTLEELGSADFDIEDFEKKTGVSISGIYTQLLRMKELFNIDTSTTSEESEPEKQAREVFRITRLI
ncbi:MAG: hypothetical protein GY804_02760 [Alphaproteobacteria bacterium]|nr:hypothetical protein [Alphaproteobacteria bacterium]